MNSTQLKNADILLKEKPVGVLVSIAKRKRRGDSEDEKIFVRQISDDIDATYAHTSRTISKFEDMGYLTTQKEGKKSLLELTDEGELIASHLIHLLKDMEEEELGVQPLMA